MQKSGGVASVFEARIQADVCACTRRRFAAARAGSRAALPYMEVLLARSHLTIFEPVELSTGAFPALKSRFAELSLPLCD